MTLIPRLRNEKPPICLTIRRYRLVFVGELTVYPKIQSRILGSIFLFTNLVRRMLY